MIDIPENRIPFALFNSKALFNPFQYLPFTKIFTYNETESKWKHNGKNLLITDEVGVGKTIESGIILRELKRTNRNLTALIVCPVKLCENWKTELHELFGLNAVNYRNTKKFGQITILPFSYFTYNIDKNTDSDISSEEENSETDNSGEEINANFEEIPAFDIIIVDEAHYMRNEEGKLYRYISGLLDYNHNEHDKTAIKVFMTGTPIVNKDSDMENLEELLGDYEKTNTRQGVANCYDFTPEITRLDINYDADNSNDPLSINAYLVKNSFGRLSMPLKRMASSSVYTLKKTVDEWLSNKFSDEQDIENEDVNNYKENLGILQEELLKRLDLSEKENAKEIAAKDAKYQALKDKIKEMFEKDKENSKVIIFCNFRKTVEYLYETLKDEYTVFSISGDAKDVDRIKQEFKETSDPAVLICSDAAKEGHNLQFCHNLIHYDYPFTAAALAQRIGRVYRRGQKQNPQIVYMHVTDSYDDRMSQIVLEKAKLTKDIGIVPLDIFPPDKSVGEMVRSWFEYRWKELEAKAGDDEKNIPLPEDVDKENGLSDDKYNAGFETIAELTGKDYDKDSSTLKKIAEELRRIFGMKKEEFYCDTVLRDVFNAEKKVDRKKIYSENVKQYLETENEIKDLLFGLSRDNSMETILKESKNVLLNRKLCENIFCDYLYKTPSQEPNDNINNSNMSLDEYKKQFKPISKIT